MKKHRQQPQSSEPNPLTWNNPFVDLKIDLPDPPAPPPPPPPPKTPQQLKREALSEEDQKLLAAFGEGEVNTVGEEESAGERKKSKGKLSFNIQRKGKGGKTVTKVSGLQRLELMEQMELCDQVKSALGCGARFVEGVLEIQGDQRTKAAQWFERQGYTC